MKTLLTLPPIFLGLSLTLYYQMLNGILLAESILLFVSTLLFFFLCILFLVSHRETKHYADSFFLSIMLSGITIPFSFLVFNYFISENSFLMILSSTLVHILMLFVGIKIVKRWYVYDVPYFGS